MHPCWHFAKIQCDIQPSIGYKLSVVFFLCLSTLAWHFGLNGEMVPCFQVMKADNSALANDVRKEMKVIKFYAMYHDPCMILQ